MTSSYPVRFFFGANTPSGFYGYHKTDLYDPRDGWIAFLIKSGAGTGKATFMREMQTIFSDMGVTDEVMLCSSDPDSLDAVVWPSLKMCIIDATAPHIIEPVAYGECEQLIPFGCCLDARKAAAQSDKWFEAADACAAAHARCCRFLAAAKSLLENNRLIAENALIDGKIGKTAATLSKREFVGVNGNARETRRFLSAFTPKGHVFFKETAAALCPKLYVIEDEHGAAAPKLLGILRDNALSAGADIITCACPLDAKNKTEHLLIPSLGVGFLTSNSHHKVDFPVFRRIHASRFTDAASLATRKQQLSFNRRAAAELLKEAARCSADAKAHHDVMEALHAKAMNWDKWQTLADEAKETMITLALARLSS